MEEETEEQIPEEDVAQSYESNVEITGATCDVVLDPIGKGWKRTRASHRLQSSTLAPKKAGEMGQKGVINFPGCHFMADIRAVCFHREVLYSYLISEGNYIENGMGF
ncbi:hypothetical protein M9H77_34617 [Catharanthus roseus]|uniref:Uncharacterized protein n=1 Tax=Catharanthus roseus TaxID=4058 RepID=A0ACB9ZNU0_CATRO|nr:hypothetical protein M9H77_34617 [Catharanthus roseus]